MGRYPDDWDTRRKRVYRRDEYSCNNCAREGGPHGDHELHAHHIVPIASGGTHNETNLVTLCKACHRSIHNKNYKAPTHAGLPEPGSSLMENIYVRRTVEISSLVVAIIVWVYLLSLVV